MMDGPLFVYRELSGAMQRVGAVESSAEGPSFKYDASYLASGAPSAISAQLPLQTVPFTSAKTIAFFDGLLPEESRRSALAAAVHADAKDTLSLLARLNLESVGGLVFLDDESFLQTKGEYLPIDFRHLEEFARAPQAKSLSLNMAARLSLAGAQAKIGLRHQGSSFYEGWSLTMGLAPSSHIVKAAAGPYEHQTVNETLCLAVARLLGYPVPTCNLIQIDGAEPLLCVERFDRVEDHMGVVHRRHQEDFCQATGINSVFKYEPTDGNYLNRMACVVGKESDDSFGDRALLLDSLLLDWALGNCDNHLKNRSLVWESDWSGKRLAPLYDLTCTTFYPQTDREMGVSLNRSRRIDEVTIADIERSAKVVGVPRSVALGMLSDLEASFLDAVEEAEEAILADGYSQVEIIAEHIRKEWKAKLQRLR